MKYYIDGHSQQNDSNFIPLMVEAFYIASTYTKDKKKKAQFKKLGDTVFDVLTDRYFGTLDNAELNGKANEYKREYRKKKKEGTK